MYAAMWWVLDAAILFPVALIACLRVWRGSNAFNLWFARFALSISFYRHPAILLPSYLALPAVIHTARTWNRPRRVCWSLRHYVNVLLIITFLFASLYYFPALAAGALAERDIRGHVLAQMRESDRLLAGIDMNSIHHQSLLHLCSFYMLLQYMVPSPLRNRPFTAPAFAAKAPVSHPYQAICPKARDAQPWTLPSDITDAHFHAVGDTIHCLTNMSSLQDVFESFGNEALQRTFQAAKRVEDAMLQHRGFMPQIWLNAHNFYLVDASSPSVPWLFHIRPIFAGPYYVLAAWLQDEYRSAWRDLVAETTEQTTFYVENMRAQWEVWPGLGSSLNLTCTIPFPSNSGFDLFNSAFCGKTRDHVYNKLLVIHPTADGMLKANRILSGDGSPNRSYDAAASMRAWFPAGRPVVLLPQDFDNGGMYWRLHQFTCDLEARNSRVADQAAPGHEEGGGEAAESDKREGKAEAAESEKKEGKAEGGGEAAESDKQEGKAEEGEHTRM